MKKQHRRPDNLPEAKSIFHDMVGTAVEKRGEIEKQEDAPKLKEY